MRNEAEPDDPVSLKRLLPLPRELLEEEDEELLLSVLEVDEDAEEELLDGAV